jgi:RNA polymerase sigma-70 factor, ECF subfamily
MQRARHLDPDALAQIHELYYPTIYRCVSFRLEDEREIEEITSDVFMRFLEGLKTRRSADRDLKNGLLRITLRLVDDHLQEARRIRGKTQHHEIENRETGSSIPDGESEPLTLQREIQKAVMMLPDDEQNIFMLRFASKLSLEQIADLTGKKVNTLKQVQFRALSSLRRLLDEDQPKDDAGKRLSSTGSEEAFDQSLARIIAGEELEAVLEQNSQWAGEFRPALEAAQAVGWLTGSITVPPDAQESSREKFLLAARTARALRPERYIMAESQRNTLPNLRIIIYLVFLIIVLVLSARFALSASRNALPGEPLYPLKLMSEETQARLERDLLKRLELGKKFDRERVSELQALYEKLQQERSLAPIDVSLAGVLTRQQPDIWQINDIDVYIMPDTRIVGQVEDGLVVDVQGILEEDGMIRAQRVEVRKLELSGEINQFNETDWSIAGLTFRISPLSVIQGELVPGSRGVVLLVENGDGEYEGRLIQVLDGEILPSIRPTSTENSTP